MSTTNEYSDMNQDSPSIGPEQPLLDWRGEQRIVGKYVPRRSGAEWPAEMDSLELVLQSGRARTVGWDGKQIWIEPDEARQLGDGEACALTLLREMRAYGAIKPTESYWIITNKAKPHIDPERGGLYRDSYGRLYSPELDKLCQKHREFMARKKAATETNPPNAREGVVVLSGLPAGAGDDQVRGWLINNCGPVLRLQRTRPGSVTVTMPWSQARAACKASKEALENGKPLRLQGWPVKIQWAEK